MTKQLTAAERTAAAAHVTGAYTVALFKDCHCGTELAGGGWSGWPKCKHGYLVINRLPAGAAPPRLQHSVTKYAKGAGLPHTARELRTEGVAKAVGRLMIADALAGTFLDTYNGRRPVALLGTVAAVAQPDAVDADAQTFAAAAESYLLEKRPEWSKGNARNARIRVDVICRQVIDPARPPFGQWPMATITKPHIEAVYAAVTARAAEGPKGNGSRRKYRQVLTHVFAEAVRIEWIPGTPITPEYAHKRLVAGKYNVRRRRIKAGTPEQPGEEERLIAAAETLGPLGRRLAWLIYAAIECGARIGELLAVQMEDIDLDEGTILLTADEPGAMKGGAGTARLVPISDRFRPFLVQAMVDPAGTALLALHYVFGNGCGGRIKNADLYRVWKHAVLLAHGITPVYGTGKQRQTLTPECSALLKQIDLHFHDTRHEAAIRWLDAKMDFRTISVLLGHSDVTQLRVYLSGDQKDAMATWRRLMQQAPKPAPAGETVVPFVRKAS